MEKKKVIMKIESFSHKDGTLLLSTSNLGLRAVLKDIVEWCEKKYSSFIQLEMSPPYPKRSISQNDKWWSLCTELGKLWYIEKYKGYDSYINKYLDNKEAKNENQMYESFSLLDNKMIETIKEQFSL